MILAGTVSIVITAWASDPISGSWFDAAKTSFVILCLVTIVVASITGIITWPPEKKRMQRTIDEQAEVIKDFSTNATRAIPTTARVVELVEQRLPSDDGDLRAAVSDLAGIVAQLRGQQTQGGP